LAVEQEYLPGEFGEKAVHVAIGIRDPGER
jgi:hypothetical protein